MKTKASAPQQVSASSKSLTSALVSWKPPVDSGATPIVEYLVEQRDVGGVNASDNGNQDRVLKLEADVLCDRLQVDKEVGWTEASRVPGTQTQTLVENLDADRKYQFRVIPEHADGKTGNESIPSAPFSTSGGGGKSVGTEEY